MVQFTGQRIKAAFLLLTITPALSAAFSPATISIANAASGSGNSGIYARAYKHDRTTTSNLRKHLHPPIHPSNAPTRVFVESKEAKNKRMSEIRTATRKRNEAIKESKMPGSVASARTERLKKAWATRRATNIEKNAQNPGSVEKASSARAMKAWEVRYRKRQKMSSASILGQQPGITHAAPMQGGSVPGHMKQWHAPMSRGRPMTASQKHALSSLANAGEERWDLKELIATAKEKGLDYGAMLGETHTLPDGTNIIKQEYTAGQYATESDSDSSQDSQSGSPRMTTNLFFK